MAPLQHNSEPPTQTYRTLQRLSEQEHQLDWNSVETVPVSNHHLGQKRSSGKRGATPHRNLHLCNVAGAGQHLFSCEACSGRCIGWHDHDKKEKRNPGGSSAGSSFQWERHDNTTRADAGLAQPQLESGQYNANFLNPTETRRKDDSRKKRSKHLSTPQSQGPVKEGVDTHAQVAEYQAFLASRSTDFIKGADDIHKGWS